MIDAVVARMCADLVSPAVLGRASDLSVLLGGIERYVAMTDEDLHQATQVCLRNLDRLDSGVEGDPGHADARLRLVLVPELWERLRPSSRDPLRRISTSLAEYDPDPARPSFWVRSRLWSAEREARLRAQASRLRDDVARTAAVDACALVEQVRFAIAGSGAADRWPPDYCVYEPGFAYRLVPVVAWRVLARHRADQTAGEDRRRLG